jgi:hypothetical protein
MENKLFFLNFFISYTAKNQYRKFEANIPRKGFLRGHRPNFDIHVSVSDLYIPTIDLPILLQELCGPILGIYTINRSQTHWD